jgi:hypothetical protein
VRAAVGLRQRQQKINPSALGVEGINAKVKRSEVDRIAEEAY